MKTLLHKKWFRRFCQTLLVLVSLVVLAVVAINWRGARMKRDAIAQMRAEGRPTSIAEMLRPLPPDEDNFAMIPVLARARDEWWNDVTGISGQTPDQARVILHEMAPKGNWNRSFAREGEPDLRRWKEKHDLSGSDAECLERFDRKYAGIIDELRAGLDRPHTLSPMLHRLAATPYDPYLTSGYAWCLENAANGFGFRAELALAAGRPDLAHESLLIAIRLAELIGTEGFLIGPLFQGRGIGRLQPTLARALESGKWDQAQVTSIRRALSALDPLDGYRRGLDLENLSSFAMFSVDALNKSPYLNDGAWWKRPDISAVSKRILDVAARRMPSGFYESNGARWARLGLQLRKDLGEGENLRSWLKACEQADARGNTLSGWDFWIHPFTENHFGRFLKSGLLHQERIQQAMVACDLETYRLDHGHYPETLRQIDSPAVVDSLTGDPFLYRTTGSGYLLYSMGTDGKDDGGQRGKQPSFRNADWIW